MSLCFLPEVDETIDSTFRAAVTFEAKESSWLFQLSVAKH